jgi:crotonobetainyl-CoA:carnitine CoA-transferase CaiB-like acyl-CoA transferase
MSNAFRDYVKNKYSRPGPLKGLRVLEVCTLLFGPAGPSVLASLGAEVIKIEMPPGGDPTRGLNPFGFFYKKQGCIFMHINTDKYYMALDLHIEAGQRIFHELCAKADIVEFNMRPAVTKSWNVGYEEIKKINPGIIYVEKNGFGQWGRYAEEGRPSNDGAAQALAGYSWISSFPGNPPLKQSIWVCDVYGALMCEVGVLAALHHRKKTGKGQYIEMSQSENIMRAMGWVWPYQQVTGKSAEPSGNRDQCICPADTFLCKDDKFVAIAAPAPEEFKALCKAMGKAELANDPRFKDHTTRLKTENALAILKMIADWAVTKTADEIEALGKKGAFPATRLHNAMDMNVDVHRRERESVKEIDDPMFGKFVDNEYPVNMSKTPPKHRWTIRPIGFDNEYIMTKILGKNQTQVAELYACGALGGPADKATCKPPPDWDGKSGAILRR